MTQRKQPSSIALLWMRLRLWWVRVTAEAQRKR